MALRQGTAAEFQAALENFAEEVGLSMEYASLRESALMSRDSITFTPPFEAGGGAGETKQAELVGKRAIFRDVNAMFVAENDRTRAPAAVLLNKLGTAAKMKNASAYTQAREQIIKAGITFDSVLTNKIVQDGDQTRSFKKAQNYFNQLAVKLNDYDRAVVTDIAAIHDKLKFKGQKKGHRLGDQKGKYMVQSKTELDNYIKLRQQQVGKLKAAWWNYIATMPRPKKKGVDQNFGKKGVAGYVKKFPGIVPYFNMVKSDKGFELEFANPIGDNDDIATFFGVMNLVYGNALQRIELDLEQLMNRDVNNF